MTTDNDSTTPQNHTQDTPTRRKRENATIIRAAHNETGKYFLLVRATAQDHRLSPEALGVLVELLSRSDDWVVQVNQLSKRHKLGREKCYRILKELTEAGYMVRTLVRDSKGKVERVEYVVHEEPTPLPEKPFSDKPDTENQHITDKRETLGDANASPNGTKPAAKTRKRTAPTARAELPQRDAMYETVERLVYGIEGADDQPYDWNSRAGIVTKWLRGEIGKWKDRTFGKISAPAQPHHVEQFLKWYTRKHPDQEPPKGIPTFVEYWRKFGSEMRGKAATNMHNPTAEWESFS